MTNSVFKVRLPRRRGPRILAAAALAFTLWSAASLWRADPPAIHRPPPTHLRYAFVLDGQSPDGFRTAKALELLRGGVVDTLLVSGVELGGGIHFSTIWVRMLPLSDAERGRVLEIRSACTSTRDEARMMEAFFRERRVDSALVVTSAFHLWRAASIFENASGSRTTWFFAGAHDSRWDEGWKGREGLKAHLLEWTKRTTWILWEQWKTPRESVKSGTIARGEDLGRFPPSAWMTAPTGETLP